MRIHGLSNLLILWGTMLPFCSLQADPINLMAGNMTHFTLHSTGSLLNDGNGIVTITFGPSNMTYVNNGPVAAVPTGFQTFQFSVASVAYPVGEPLPNPVNFPINVMTPFSMNFGSGQADFMGHLTVASVQHAINESPTTGMGSVNMSPYPAIAPGPYGVTLLGSALLTNNQSAEDLSLFTSAAGGGLFAIQLASSDLWTQMLNVFDYGGTVEGQGAFLLIGGYIDDNNGGGGSEIPEPTTLLAWGGAMALGGWYGRRRGWFAALANRI